MTTRTNFYLLIILLFFSPLFSYAEPIDWPNSIKSKTGFYDLGKAIAQDSDFPATGTDIEKAKYIFSHLPRIASKYDLKMGNGGLWSSFVIGVTRMGNDPENADPLKTYPYWGNCGDWSYAFSEVLHGAGVKNRVAYGDSSSSQGYSKMFTGTDTMVIVDDVAPDGKVSRRVFDPFRAGYSSNTYQPTDETIKQWSDIPLSDSDKWQNETNIYSWQTIVGKPFVKDASTQALLPEGNKLLVNGEVHSTKPISTAANTSTPPSPTNQSSGSGTTYVAGKSENAPTLTAEDSGGPNTGTSSSQTPPPVVNKPPSKTALTQGIDFAVAAFDKQGIAVQNVLVEISGPMSGSSVGPDGTTVFKGFQEGTYRLKVSAKGYITVVMPVTVTSDMGADINGYTGVSVLLEKGQGTEETNAPTELSSESAGKQPTTSSDEHTAEQSSLSATTNTTATSSPSATAATGSIHVVAGTYGGNCKVAHGNVSGALASACNGKSHCIYTIDYKVIGDPAFGCAKNYVAEWTCGTNANVMTDEATPEAGYQKTVTLSCDNPQAVSQAATTGTAVLFNNPMVDGYLLDNCVSKANQCGQASADAFCKKQGFIKATNFTVREHYPTKCIGDGFICDKNTFSHCDGITSVTCNH